MCSSKKLGKGLDKIQFIIRYHHTKFHKKLQRHLSSRSPGTNLEVLETNSMADEPT